MPPEDTSPGDDILRWVSENGAGSWGALRDAVGHVMGTRPGVGLRPWQMVGPLSALGHLDIDWHEGRWSASPPCIVLSRDMGLCAFLAGWRTTHLLARYNEACNSPDVFPFDVAQGHAPRALFAKCRSVELVEEVAACLGVPVAYDPASQLVDLVSLAEPAAELASPPPADETLRIFDPRRLVWETTEDRERPGLYEFELHGRKVFRLRSDDWYTADRSEGQLRMLAGRDDLLRWHPPSSDLTTPRVLRVHGGLSLPAVAERALVAASGLLPDRVSGWRVYRNVPFELANRLAGRLSLQSRVESTPLTTWRT